MPKKIFLFLLNIFLFEVGYTQIIKGTIIDYHTNEALIGVNIILENGEGTSSDFNGEYTLNLKTNKKQNITFKYIGYEKVIKTIKVTKEKIQNINVALSPSSEQLSTVVVSAGRFEQKIEEITVSMEVIKPSLIENKNTTDIQTVMDQIPGVNITDGQANIRGGSGVELRSWNTCISNG